jgi:hypothetical protein
MTETGLFGQILDPNASALSDADRKRLQRRAQSKNRQGYAWTPGTGPDGETCRTCRHLVRNQLAKVYLKCGLMRANWTGGSKTDVYARSPACKKWEPKG